ATSMKGAFSRVNPFSKIDEDDEFGFTNRRRKWRVRACPGRNTVVEERLRQIRREYFTSRLAEHPPEEGLRIPDRCSRGCRTGGHARARRAHLLPDGVGEDGGCRSRHRARTLACWVA